MGTSLFGLTEQSRPRGAASGGAIPRNQLVGRSLGVDTLPDLADYLRSLLSQPIRSSVSNGFLSRHAVPVAATLASSPSSARAVIMMTGTLQPRAARSQASDAGNPRRSVSYYPMEGGKLHFTESKR